MTKRQFSFSTAVSQLVSATRFSRDPEYRHGHPFVDREWIRAETLLAAFGMPLADGIEIEFKDRPWSPGGPNFTTMDHS